MSRLEALHAALAAVRWLPGCDCDDCTRQARAERLLGRLDTMVALLEEMRDIRPGLKVVLLTPAAAPEDLIRAMRAHVFAVFDAPFVGTDVADMVKLAVQESERSCSP